MARLGDICKFQSGGTPSKSEAEYYNGGIPWITTVALNGSTISEKDAVEWITEKAIMKSAAKIVPANSIMVGTRVGVGKVAINSVPMSTSQDVISLLEIDEARWSKAYICKFILAKGTYLNSQARGATIKGIKIDTLAQLQLPEIPLDEQARIAGIIDKIDDMIALRKEQLAKLEELVKARFVEMFGDSRHNSKRFPVKKLGDLCKVGSSKRIYQNELSSNGVPFLRVSDLNKQIEEGVCTPELFISEAKYDEFMLRGLVPKAGDILVTSRGTLGKCYIVNNVDRFYFQDGMISWLSDMDSNVSSLYISYLFSTAGIQEQIMNLQAGSTVAYLSIAMLRRLDIMLPTILEQEQFVAFVEQTNKTKLTIQASLDKLEVMKKALMQEYFG